MPVKLTDIYYIAGLLEGEGCFGFYNNCPSIQLTMTDLDTVEKARLALDLNRTNKIRRQPKGSGRQDQYVLSVSGDVSIQWMMTIYSLMSIRRKAKIREVIQRWRDRVEITTEMKSEQGKDQRMIRLIAMSRKISYEDAKKIYNDAVKAN